MSSETAFVRANTARGWPPLVPEIALYLASEVTPLWHATEASLEKSQLPPPYWAFAWAGGQALARHVLDHPELVRGHAALDFGAGSGLLAIAAMKSGASHAIAAEIDGFAVAAIALNAEANDVAVTVERSDIIGSPCAASIILVGDMCYERPLAERLTAWLRELARGGATILLGDPGRTYLPKDGLTEIGRYPVPTPLDLEDRIMRETVVWQLRP